MPRSSEIRVGLLLLVALVVAGIGILLVGQEQNLFRKKNSYFIRFETVQGLSTGSPVQLNGVFVGTVQRVILPRDPRESEIRVWISVDERYEQRIRSDSEARIGTLGLLGDRYVEITSGSLEAEVIPDEGEIPAAPATSVDELLASGEDVMDNVTSITFSLRTILKNMEEGKGLLGKLTTESETSERLSTSLMETLDSLQRVAEVVETGEGPLPRLLNDRELADRLEGSLTRLDGVLTELEQGDGLLPGLLSDPQAKVRFEETMERLNTTLANLEELSARLNQAEGLLPKLMTDEAYARQISRDLEELVSRLNAAAGKLAEGEGTAAKLLDDPEIYQALNDILIGIDESWMLRWLIRNRQKAGIEARYEDEQHAPEEEKGPEEEALPEEPDAGREAPQPEHQPPQSGDPVDEASRSRAGTEGTGDDR